VFRDNARLNLRQVDDTVVDPLRRDTEQLLAASITLQDWGARTFIVRDPDGNLLLFAGRGE